MESFDCSKFRMTAGVDGIGFKSRSRGDRTQTAIGSRTVDMCFNESNRAELVYPRAESRA